jgi:hypothetical protein
MKTRKQAMAMINEGVEILNKLDHPDIPYKPKGWRAEERRAANVHTGFVCDIQGISWDDSGAKWRVYRKDLSLIGMFTTLDIAIAAKKEDMRPKAGHLWPYQT